MAVKLFFSKIWTWVIAAGLGIGMLVWHLYRRAVDQRDAAVREVEQAKEIHERAEKIRAVRKQVHEAGQVRVEEVREKAQDPERRRDHFESQ